MAYARTDGEKTVGELAHRLYGIEESSREGREAATALRKANPELRRIADVPAGTVIEVPTVDLPDPVAPLIEFPELAGSVAVHGIQEDLADLRHVLGGLLDERLDDAVRAQRRLRSKGVKEVARSDQAFADHLERVAAEIQDELDEVRALRVEQRRALALLAEDLDQLADVFTGRASSE